VAQRIAEISLGCEYCGDRSDLPHDPLVANYWRVGSRDAGSAAFAGGGRRDHTGWTHIARCRTDLHGLKVLLDRAGGVCPAGDAWPWCDDTGARYVNDLARNSRLIGEIGWERADDGAEPERWGLLARPFAEFPCLTLTRWLRWHRAGAEVEHLPEVQPTPRSHPELPPTPSGHAPSTSGIASGASPPPPDLLAPPSHRANHTHLPDSGPAPLRRGHERNAGWRGRRWTSTGGGWQGPGGGARSWGGRGDGQGGDRLLRVK